MTVEFNRVGPFDGRECSSKNFNVYISNITGQRSRDPSTHRVSIYVNLLDADGQWQCTHVLYFTDETIATLTALRMVGVLDTFTAATDYKPKMDGIIEDLRRKGVLTIGLGV